MKKNGYYIKICSILFYTMVGLSLVLLLNFHHTIKCLASEQENIQDKTKQVGTLYAQSAVLMDGSSGRVLYEKNGEEFLANASTTKIMTCILALENAELNEVVTVSAYAATMPDVQLHIKEGEQYYLGDLLYSLMLESHNDVAVAIAEHISGSQEEFSKLMNRKAREIGCKNTNFLTPNGLDATQKIKNKTEENAEQEVETYQRQETNGGEKIAEQEVSHGTTASDLALIMRYCIKISPQKENFIRITRTPNHTFQNISKTRNFTCRNHNAFLNMMDGVISGKTGFTGKAGYCYVGALEQDGECYIVALLACGWPGNKNYKWSDCKKLMTYGLKEYELFKLADLEECYKKDLIAEVRNAKREKIEGEEKICLKRKENDIREVLLKNGEKIMVKVRRRELEAPLKPGDEAGQIEYYIGDKKWLTEELFYDKEIEKIDFGWCMQKIVEKINIY